MHIFIFKLKHKPTAIYSLLLLWLLSLQLIIGYVHADDDDDKFIHLNSELNDDFYKKVHFISDIKEGERKYLLLEIRHGYRSPNFHNSTPLPDDWSSSIAELGLQYAWKSSTSEQRFFDYVHPQNYPDQNTNALVTENNRQQYTEKIASNLNNCTIFLGLTTVRLKGEPENGHFVTYKLPKLKLDFNKGMLKNLFIKDHKTITFRRNLYIAKMNSLEIAGIVDGGFYWENNKKNTNNNAFIISNSDRTTHKVLYLRHGLNITKGGKIQASKDKTALKINFGLFCFNVHRNRW
jgi:hypothetical protein